ncbi:MAG: NADH dehydrogenase subunit E [Planctomycetota bacterium]|nr:MAG: NADH dehydrogenase subunit E [Planctomycetota bacterium]
MSATERSERIELSEEGQRQFAWLLGRYPQRRAVLLPLLRIIERERGRIDQAGIELAAELIGISPAEVLSVVTFYTHFKCDLPGRRDGRYVIWVCNTLPCALRGARQLTQALEQKLGIAAGGVTPDGRFSLRKTECLASCDTAPCMQIDDRHYDRVTAEQLDEILAEWE